MIRICGKVDSRRVERLGPENACTRERVVTSSPHFRRRSGTPSPFSKPPRAATPIPTKATLNSVRFIPDCQSKGRAMAHDLGTGRRAGDGRVDNRRALRQLAYHTQCPSTAGPFSRRSVSLFRLCRRCRSVRAGGRLHPAKCAGAKPAAPPPPVRKAAIAKLFKTPDRHPNALDVTEDGFWIGEQVTDRVILMDITGRVLKAFQTECHNCSGLAVGGGYLWLSANGAAQFDWPIKINNSSPEILQCRHGRQVS